MAVSKLNDLEIRGQLMDDHNPLRQPPRPSKGLMDIETSTPSSLEPTRQERGPASSYMIGICYRITINLFTVGAPTTLSLTSQESVTNSPFKPPLTTLPND